eukprot:g50802.t1
MEFRSCCTSRVMLDSQMRLPFLDIRTWRTNPAAFAEELRQACHRTGFFLLHHDLPAELCTRMLAESKDFFELPLEQKQEISYAKSAAFRGYMPLGVENTAGVTDLREQVEIGPEEEQVAKDKWASTPPYERLRGPNQWPDEHQPKLQPVVWEYTQHMLRLSRELTWALCYISLRYINSYRNACVWEYTQHMLRLSRELTLAFCAAIKVPPADLIPLLEPNPHWQLKLACYHPAKQDKFSKPDPFSSKPDANERSRLSFGVGAHTDTGFLTLLLQDKVGGLQAYVDGAWGDVWPAGPQFLVCNIGEVAEILTKGYFRATPHRAISSPNHRRYSVPFFFNPKLSATVDPLPKLVAILPWERKPGDKPWSRPDNALLCTYGDNAFKSLARSHPAVFKTHHSDLEVTAGGLVQLRTQTKQAKEDKDQTPRARL